MSKRLTSLSDTELEVLRVLWDVGPSTVRQLNELLDERGRRWAYTTVLTLVQRLLAKGYVASDKSSVAHVYRALVSRDQLLRQRLSRLSAELCEGTATPLVNALVDAQRFSADDIQHFRQLLDELETRQAKTRRRK